MCCNEAKANEAELARESLVLGLSVRALGRKSAGQGQCKEGRGGREREASCGNRHLVWRMMAAAEESKDDAMTRGKWSGKNGRGPA